MLAAVVAAIVMLTHGHVRLPMLPCAIIKPLVEFYGEEQAKRWAREHDYTEAQIRAMERKCKA